MTKPKTGATIPPAPKEGIDQIDIVNLQRSVRGLKNAGLSTQAFLSYLDFKREVDDICTTYFKGVDTLMEAYKIKKQFNALVNAEDWAWQQHPKKEEIREKLEALGKVKVTLKTVNFVPATEFYETTKASKMDLNQVAFISKYIMAKK